MAVKISPSTLWLWDCIKSMLRSLWFTSAKADIEKRVNQWGTTEVFQKLACMSGQEKLWGRILSALEQRSTMRFYHCLQRLIAGDRDDEIKHCLLKTYKLLQGEFQLDIWKCFVLTVGSPESLWNFDPGRYKYVTGQGSEQPDLTLDLALLWDGTWIRWLSEDFSNLSFSVILKNFRISAR